MLARILFFLAALTLVIAPGASTPALAQASPYEINVILALTGAAAFIGTSEQKSLQLLEALTNKAGGIKGRPISFVIADDQSNPQVTVQLANQLIAKNVPVILGPTYTATCLAVGPLVKTGPVDYCFSPSISPPAGSFQYSSTVSTRDDARALLHYYRDHGWTKIALITSTDASGQQFEGYFDAALKLPENAAMTAVTHEHFNPADLNITAQAERIKASGAQAMIGWTAGTPTGTLLRGLHDAGIDIPVASGNGNMIHAQLVQYEGGGERLLRCLQSRRREAEHRAHASLGSCAAGHRCDQEAGDGRDRRTTQYVYPASQRLDRHQRCVRFSRRQSARDRHRWCRDRSLGCGQRRLRPGQQTRRRPQVRNGSHE
jgi:hypothetical protein